MTARLTFHHGDNREVLRRLIEDGVRVQSVVCDPPYGLTTVTKRFGKTGAAPALHGTDGAFQRASGGFMGQSWDASGIERDPEFWRLVHDILLPGGYCLAFSSPRTGHWMAVAMETVGFVMHPFLGWAYGSGFPKAHDAAKAITAFERTGGAGPEAIRRTNMGDSYEPSGRDRVNYDNGCGSKMNGSVDPVELADAARKWEGWKYGAQSMKPALEPIYVAQRPFDQKNGALNLLEHGVGAMNIDACRVATTDGLGGGAYAAEGGRASLEGDDRQGAAAGMFQPGKTAGRDFVRPNGRHPANLLHDGSAEVRKMFPITGGGDKRGKCSGTRPGGFYDIGEGESGDGHPCGQTYADIGSAVRFFNAFPLDPDPLFYCPKAGKVDRAGSKHPTVKPIALMRWLCRLVTPPGGTVLDPFAGSGTTGAAALAEGFNCTLIEVQGDYADDIRRRFDPFPDVFLTADEQALIGCSSTIDEKLLELIG